MEFHVAGLLREPVGATRLHTFDNEPPLRKGSVELVRTPGAVLVRVEATVIIEADCSRCLAPFGYQVEVAFEEEYFQQVDVATGARLPREQVDEDEFRIRTDHIIDITEAVRQYSEASAEMRPLCRPDCPGLCQHCGKDLGIEACACEGPPIDSRWLGLSALKQSRDGQ